MPCQTLFDLEFLKFSKNRPLKKSNAEAKQKRKLFISWFRAAKIWTAVLKCQIFKFFSPKFHFQETYANTLCTSPDRKKGFPRFLPDRSLFSLLEYFRKANIQFFREKNWLLDVFLNIKYLSLTKKNQRITYSNQKINKKTKKNTRKL